MAWNQQAVDQWYQENLQRGANKNELDAIVGQKMTEYVASQGVPIDQIQTNPDLLRAQILQLNQGSYKKPLSADEQKKNLALTEVDRIVGNLENQYFGGEDLSKGRVGGLTTSIGSIIGMEPEAKTYQKSRKMARAKLARALGEVGALSEPEQEAAIALLPTLFSTPEEATMAFDEIRKMLGIKENDLTDQAESLSTTGLERTANALIPATVRGVKSAYANPLEGSQRLAIGMPGVGVAAGLADLLGVKNELGEKYREQAMSPAIELSSKYGLAKGIAGLGKKALTGGGIKGSVSRARDVAAQNASKGISVDKIIRAGDDYVAKDPLAAKTWEAVKSSLKSGEMSVADALERTSIWNKAYTSAGRVGKSGKMGLFDALAKATKSQIKDVAPEVASKTAALNRLYKGPKTLRKGLFYTGLAGGSLGGASALYNLLKNKLE